MNMREQNPMPGLIVYKVTEFEQRSIKIQPRLVDHMGYWLLGG